MPITSAATSMSRTDIHARPVAERTRFLAASASTVTMASTNRYFFSGVSIATPNRSSRCAVITPDELLLENQGNLVSAHTTKNCAASVATAR
ncbi:hypothetical protein D9M72_392810 [compost metagenome]